MPLVTRHSLLTVVILASLAIVAAGAAIWFGFYNMGADDPHMRVTYRLLDTMRERSIATRARELVVPGDLADPKRIAQGAGNYNAMCTGCHLTPGMAATELSGGLYPAPPNLTKETVDAATAFWVIKHGIKASGMPAWGKNMSDEYVWNMAAFLQQLPTLDAAQYKTLVARSGGHSHGGGESMPHSHAAGEADDHHDEEDGHDAMGGMPMDESKPHAHPAGTAPHDDGEAAHSDMDMTSMPADQSKPHSHASGTPPHDDGDRSTPAPVAPKPHVEDGHAH